MDQVILQTSSGEFITKAYITPFKRADGVRWKGRYFRFHRTVTDRERIPTRLYREEPLPPEQEFVLEAR